MLVALSSNRYPAVTNRIEVMAGNSHRLGPSGEPSALQTRHGRVRDAPPAPRAPRTSATTGAGAAGASTSSPGSPTSIQGLPRSVRKMLDDTSDGRNNRAFRAAAELVEGNYPNEQIIYLVLSSPLGAKGRECDPYSPARWVQQKIDSAVARYGLEQFDADQ